MQQSMASPRMWTMDTSLASRQRHHDQRQPVSLPISPFNASSKASTREADSFHVQYKVPTGDSPYVKAKRAQLVDKDPDRAIALFWAAINAGDRVDSSLKDMAIVMKQQNRPEEAVEAIKSLRNRCSEQAQESLDNVLLDLYKRCGRLEEQIALLKHKLNLIHKGMAFNGKRTKTARSQGKKFQVSIEQEATRLLGNLGWAYMQQSNYIAAEAVYRKALSIEPDNNKVCNLGICLMKQNRLEEAKNVLQSVTLVSANKHSHSESHIKSYERAQEMLEELDITLCASKQPSSTPSSNVIRGPEFDLWSHWKLWEPPAFHQDTSSSEAYSSQQEQFSDSSDGGDSWEADEMASEIVNCQARSPFASEDAPNHVLRADALQQQRLLDSSNGWPNRGRPEKLATIARSNIARNDHTKLNSSKIDCHSLVSIGGEDGGVSVSSSQKHLQITPQPNLLPTSSSASAPGKYTALSHNAWRGTMPWKGESGEENCRQRFYSPGSLSQSLSKVLTTMVERSVLDPKTSRRQLDFTRVDSVIGSIVSDAPPASEAMETDLQTDVNTSSSDATYSPSSLSIWPPEPEMVRQRRLRVFQDMTLCGSARA